VYSTTHQESVKFGVAFDVLTLKGVVYAHWRVIGSQPMFSGRCLFNELKENIKLN